jgi:hypothetical protein
MGNMIYYLNAFGVIIRAYDLGKELNDEKFGIWFNSEKECINRYNNEGYDF